MIAHKIQDQWKYVRIGEKGPLFEFEMPSFRSIDLENVKLSLYLSINLSDCLSA